MSAKRRVQTDAQKAEAEALAADPIGGKPPIDVAQERALEDAEPLGYVDPESQKEPKQPNPRAAERRTARASANQAAAKERNAAKEQGDDEAPAPSEPAPSAVTRDDTKGDANA